MRAVSATMTDRSPAIDPAASPASKSVPARRPAPRRPGFGPTILASVACFLVLFEFLAFQLHSGNDPALGAPAPASAQAAVRPAVIDRKIIKRRMVHQPPSSQAPATGSATPVASATGASTGAAAPAPAPAAAPAPAPAPAAPVTSTS